MRKIVLLDLDGTIVDSYRSVLLAIEKALDNFGIQAPFSLYQETEVGRLLSVVADCLPPTLSMVEFKSVYDALLMQNPTFGVDVKKSTIDWLNKLKVAGYELVVLTNKRQEVADMICKSLFPLGLFACVIGRCTSETLKPLPKVKDVLKTYGIMLSDIVMMVGDSGTDYKTAKLLGVRYVDVRYDRLSLIF